MLQLKIMAMVALIACATAAFAGQDGSIDLFPFGVDPITGTATTVDFGQCQGSPSPTYGGFGQMLILGVFARLNGASLRGIADVELFVEGVESLPGFGTQWSVRVEYPDNAVPAEGVNALFLTRATPDGPVRRQNVVWSGVTGPETPNCQKGALTEIARIYLSNVGSPPAAMPDDWRVRVVAGDPSSNPNFHCPLLVSCDYPFFPKYCVTGGEFIVNPVGSHCSVAVEPTTWGQVKALFR